MNAMAPIFGLVVIAALYVIIGPLLMVIGLRVALWIGVGFGLDDALGVFAADIRRSFDAHRRSLDRESGGGFRS